jgi:lipopolysaccharide heptosyltransferase II
LLLPVRRVSNPESGRFLIVSSTGIGDTLWGTPAIAALREACPRGHIAVLTNPAGSEILKGNPAIDELLVFERGASALFRVPLLVRLLRKKRFEKVFIFHASDRIIWPISFFTGSPEITGFSGQSKDMDFILTRVVGVEPAVHGVENRFRMLAAAGIEGKDGHLELHLTGDDEEEARLFLKENGVGETEMVIGLHPGAQKPFKCWPAKNFIEAGKILRGKFGCRIVVTGNAKERELGEEVASGIEGAISSAGCLSLRGTAALIKRISLFITNDTGPMHMAFALKTPVVSLFSPTDPALCGPYKVEKVIVLSKNTTCAQCTGKKCYNPICLSQISAQEVAEAAGLLLAGCKIR